MADEMDFSEMDGMDDIDWSDVESELQQNKEMIQAAATGGGDSPADSGGGDAELAVDGDVGVEFLMKIPLKLEVEVGEANIYIKELLAIGVGSVFELKKRLGEPMNIKINDKLVAKGEIIIQNEKFGIKIVKILDKEKRLASLKL